MADVKPGPDQIVIANDLRTGFVVFFTDADSWSEDPADAAFADSKDAAVALLERARAHHDANRVVDPTLIAAQRGGDGPRPTRNREVIRAQGPTVRRDLGYQAEGRGA